MDLFWTTPSIENVTPTDPLGLDAMRDELADKLVPSLTGRTRSHEDFYWCLVFIGWSSVRPSEKERIAQFLDYERWLKLCWFHQGREGFAGSRQAKKQANQSGAPVKKFSPLLKNQRSQGLLGAHLEPLRKIGLVHLGVLKLTGIGSKLVEGAGHPICGQDLPEGVWERWHQRFEKAMRGYSPAFKRKLRRLLAGSMPWLPEALSRSDWRTQQAWTKAAKYLDPGHAPYARLAGEFIDWAEMVRTYFECLGARSIQLPFSCPPRLKNRIPTDLNYWKPFQAEFQNWTPKSLPGALARIHKTVFYRRHYGDSDLWVQLQNGELRWRRGTAKDQQVAEGSDCRWSNAVALLKP